MRQRTKSEGRRQKLEGRSPETGQRIAIYPGSFDPITLGHLDVVKRAVHLFDKVVVAVASRQEKHPLFTWKERIQLAEEVTSGMDRVVVRAFDCLLVDFVREQNAQAIIRGMRAVMDFDYEFQMALTNRKLAPAVETIFFVPSERYFYLSSSLVRELAAKGGELTCFVPEPVVKALRSKLTQ
ncbi:pantetheine-phosphate adenylyltransferase [candidate division WOR-3 bacterium]|nr:pantetheine-phosphate adenylyltransferase [candidate division WOR-3 bacterium]